MLMYSTYIISSPDHLVHPFRFRTVSSYDIGPHRYRIRIPNIGLASDVILRG